MIYNVKEERFFNVEAEKAVLYLAFVEKQALPIILERLTKEHFYVISHQIIFDAFVQMYQKKIDIDFLSILNFLANNSLMAKVGGREKVTELLQESFYLENISSYISILEEKHARRRLRKYASDLLEKITDEPDVYFALDEAKAFLDKVKVTQSCPVSSIDEIFDQVLARYEFESLHGNAKIQTQYYELDALLGGGLEPGEVIIIAGRPAMGKSAFAASIAFSVSRQCRHTLIFSLEMPATLIAKRLFSEYFNENNFHNIDLNYFVDFRESLKKIKLYLDDSSGITIESIATKSKALLANKSEAEKGCIVIDYVQLIECKGENREKEISRISRSLKKLALELKIPIIVLSQLSRAVENRQNKKPLLSDLRESGSLEQDADIVIAIYRDDYYDPNSELKGIAELGVLKNRNGRTGSVQLLFDPTFVKFKNKAY
jgi:replicative DNA helicase